MIVNRHADSPVFRLSSGSGARGELQPSFGIQLFFAFCSHGDIPALLLSLARTDILVTRGIGYNTNAMVTDTGLIVLSCVWGVGGREGVSASECVRACVCVCSCVCACVCV